MRNIFLVILSVIITLICVRNPQSVQFNLLGETQIALWKLLLTFFISGILFINLLKIGKKQQRIETNRDFDLADEENNSGKPKLSDEDREYLS
ncbi:hypothetical protein [Sphingobacterium sp.]|uniref:hypothetical protein n=1 Tax=Sphingobacterium sp. TaxID=341027 RepID=UPI0028A1E645|nr:hypothetical protein [Sphingobacterium sp.]